MILCLELICFSGFEPQFNDLVPLVSLSGLEPEVNVSLQLHVLYNAILISFIYAHFILSRMLFL